MYSSISSMNRAEAVQPQSMLPAQKPHAGSSRPATLQLAWRGQICSRRALSTRCSRQSVVLCARVCRKLHRVTRSALQVAAGRWRAITQR